MTDQGKAQPKSTIQNQEDVMDYVFGCTQLSQKAVKFLKEKMGITTPFKLFVMDDQVISDSVDGSKFLSADQAIIAALKMWLVTYVQEGHDGFPHDWEIQFNADVFETFCIEEGARAKSKKKQDAYTEYANNTSKYVSRPRMSDYPSFNGKMDTWYTFADEFSGTALGQGYGEILEEYQGTDNDTSEVSEEFKSKSEFIYSVLQRNCVKGIAASKVTAR